MIRPPWDLEPAPGRVLITKHYEVYEILGTDPLLLNSRLYPGNSFKSYFSPARGEWIAPDLLALRTWARLNGVRLK